MMGRKHSIESKIKTSNATKGENNPMYGKTHTKEVMKKIVCLIMVVKRAK